MAVKIITWIIVGVPIAFVIVYAVISFVNEIRGVFKKEPKYEFREEKQRTQQQDDDSLWDYMLYFAYFVECAVAAEERRLEAEEYNKRYWGEYDDDDD